VNKTVTFTDNYGPTTITVASAGTSDSIFKDLYGKPIPAKLGTFVYVTFSHFTQPQQLGPNDVLVVRGGDGKLYQSSLSDGPDSGAQYSDTPPDPNHFTEAFDLPKSATGGAVLIVHENGTDLESMGSDAPGQDPPSDFADGAHEVDLGLGTNVIGGNSGKSQSEFTLQVNEKVLGPLDQADQTAAEHASTTNGRSSRAADGRRIVQVADQASAYLRGLSGLSAQQGGQVQLLLVFVAANQRYGQAFASFAPEDNQSQLALEGAAAAARAAIATVQSGLPADLRLPSQTAFISLSASPPSPTTTTTSTATSTTPPAANLAVVYVQQVDGLLSRSNAVVLALRSFIPHATSNQISRSAAVAAANSYLGQRRLELEQARALSVPSQFALAHGLLIRSLEASVADDQALVAWTVARRDGSGNAQAALDEVNRLGAQATGLKQQFLRVYGQQRQAATGRSPASLPNIF
jgi:hypothetical protein